jgi:gamma-glutamyltranspeptidase / glutathione hydrolase
MSNRGVCILAVAVSCALLNFAPGPASSTQGASATRVNRDPPGWAFPAESLRPVYSRRGLVITTDSIASAVGVGILRRGGNAIDAAIATHFALAVVNPEAGNIGGGGFMIVRKADGTTAALDFRETAPRAATRDMFLDSRGEMTERSVIGHLAAAVPASVAGMWEAHRRFGSKPWPELLQPAIELADGLIVHPRLAASLREHRDRFQQFAGTAAIFGAVPDVGDRFAQRDLAATLRRIQSRGAAGFYRGRTADLIVAEMRRGGGIITLEDLAAYRAVWRNPLRFRYRDHEVISMPPPSSGGATIGEMLKILEGFDLRSVGHLSVDHVHLLAEAARRAFADRNAYLGDPDFVPQPVARMTSAEYAAVRRASIRRDRATRSDEISPGLGAPAAGEHTTHYSIVDSAGNAVAVTTTLNSLYGSRVTVTGAGFLLNNVMDDFTAKVGVPNQFGLVQGAANAIAGGKRMLSAMTPTMVLDSHGRVRVVTGSPGGATIITTVAQVVSHFVYFEMTVAASTAAPRLHHQHLPDVLRFERDGLDSAVVAQLRARGHEVSERSGYQGDVQTIFVLPDGRLSGVADPRRGGAAIAVEAARVTVP